MPKFVIENIIIEKSDKDIKTGVKYDFASGLNLVFGDNEAGKSSLMKFIKQAFFRPSSIDTGKIFFSVNNKKYRADISKNQKVDKRCLIYDENSSGCDYSLIENFINKKYFEEGFAIDLDDLMDLKYDNNLSLVNVIKDPSCDKLNACLKTVNDEIDTYISSSGKPRKTLSEISDSIKSKTNQINDLKCYENDYNQAVEGIQRYDEELQLLTKKEQKLKLLEINAKIKQIENEFNSKLFNSKEKYVQIIQNTGKFESYKENLNKDYSRLESIKNKLNENLNRLNTEFSLNPNEESLAGFNVDFSKINTIKELLNEIDSINIEIKSYEKTIENIEDTILKITGNIDLLNKNKDVEKPQEKLSLVLTIAFVISTIAAFYFKQPLIGFFCLFLTCLSAIKLVNTTKTKMQQDAAKTSFQEKMAQNESDLKYNENKKQNILDKIKLLDEKIKTAAGKIQDLISKDSFNIHQNQYLSAVELIKTIQNDIKEKEDIQNEIEKTNKQIENIVAEFNNFIVEDNVNIDLSTSLSENTQRLRAANEKNNSLKQQIDLLNSHKEKFDEIDIEVTETLEEIAQKKKIALDTKKEYEYKKRSLEAFEGITKLKNEKNVRSNEYKDIVKKLLVNKAVIGISTIAKNNFDKTQPDLVNAQKYLSILTDGKYTQINLEAEEIMNEEGSVIKKWEQLSRGTKEQLYLALRLGYASNYTLKDKNRVDLPFIIDDAFVNFDPNRTKNALKCLMEFSKTNQVLYFTCHKDFLDDAEINKIYIN